MYENSIRRSSVSSVNFPEKVREPQTKSTLSRLYALYARTYWALFGALSERDRLQMEQIWAKRYL